MYAIVSQFVNWNFKFATYSFFFLDSSVYTYNVTHNLKSILSPINSLKLQCPCPPISYACCSIWGLILKLPSRWWAERSYLGAYRVKYRWFPLFLGRSLVAAMSTNSSTYMLTTMRSSHSTNSISSWLSSHHSKSSTLNEKGSVTVTLWRSTADNNYISYTVWNSAWYLSS